ncbi:MAG: RNA chaperone Hfq [Candidatus Bipolaricaulaceae bacterium]
MAKEEIREWVPEGRKEAAPAGVKEGKPSTPPKSKEKPPEPEKLLVGNKVIVRFMDGTVLAGTLVSMHQYTFVLEYDGKRVLVYKHGVKLIEGLPA